MKAEIEQLIDRLSIRPRRCDCKSKHCLECVEGRPNKQLRIGDVLEKMLKNHQAATWENNTLSYNDKRDNQVIAGKPRELIDLWGHCGFTKSLQSILAECEWEKVAECECGAKFSLPAPPAYHKCWESHHHVLLQVPKQKPIRELFEFLISFNLAE